MTRLPRTPSFRLDGKRALVTGASSGIGQGCAVALAEAGAHVVCAARGVEKLQATVDAMAAEGWSAEVPGVVANPPLPSAPDAFGGFVRKAIASTSNPPV